MWCSVVHKSLFPIKTVCHWNTIEAENTLIGTSDFNTLSKLAAVPVIILYRVNGNSVFNATHAARSILPCLFQDVTGSLICDLALYW